MIYNPILFHSVKDLPAYFEVSETFPGLGW